MGPAAIEAKQTANLQRDYRTLKSPWHIFLIFIFFSG
jgi:hypothetical protein